MGKPAIHEEPVGDQCVEVRVEVEVFAEGLGVLLEVELAALPRDGGEDGGACGGKAGVGVANQELETVEATGLKGGQEVAPVDFGFAEGDTDTEDGAFALGVDVDGDEDGAVEDLAAVADFFVAGVEGAIGEGAEWALAPGMEFGVELGGAFADLGGADGVAAEFLDDGASTTNSRCSEPIVSGSRGGTESNFISQVECRRRNLWRWPIGRREGSFPLPLGRFW